MQYGSLKTTAKICAIVAGFAIITQVLLFYLSHFSAHLVVPAQQSGLTEFFAQGVSHAQNGTSPNWSVELVLIRRDSRPDILQSLRATFLLKNLSQIFSGVVVMLGLSEIGRFTLDRSEPQT
jgi:hypothetical protein